MWNVYDAAHNHVATYSTEQAAASHVAAWPALYYSVAPQVPTPGSLGPASHPDKSTRMKSDG